MKKRKKMKFISIVSAFLSLVLCLSACGSGGDAQTDSEGAKADSVASVNEGWHVEENTLPIADGDIELSIYCGMPNSMRQEYTSMAETDVVKQIMEETGIKLTFVHPPENDDGTFFTTMIASGDYPDIIYDGFGAYPGGPTAAMDDGIIMDITDLVQSKAYYFYHIMDNMDPEVREKRIWSDDGRILYFGTTFSSDYLDGRVHGGFLVRKDILDKAGITELPKTIDEYEVMFEAFKEEGLVPWAVSLKEWQFTSYNPVASAFGLTAKGTNLDENGKVEYSRVNPEYKNFLEVMHRWYEKGYITSDALTQSTSDAQKQFQSGEAGAILCGSYEISTLKTVGQANDPELEVVALPFPRVNEDDKITTMATVIQNPDSRKAFISAQCEHPEEAVRLIDYLYKPETIMLTAWGVNTDEHTLWTEDADGNRSWTDFMTNNPDFDFETARQRYTASSLQGQWETTMEKMQYDTPEVQQAWEVWADNTSNEDLMSNYVTQTTEESRELSQLLTQIETYGDEMVFKFITGERSVDEFDAFVEELKAMGTDRLCELYQAAQDRYMERD